MKKAIIVTAKNKKLNIKYLSNNEVGDKVVFNDRNFPNTWAHNDWRKLDFKNVNVAFHEEAGFYPYVIMEGFDVALHVLTTIEFDNKTKTFNHLYRDLTQEELDDKAEQQEQSQFESAEELNKINASDEWLKIQKLLRKNIIDGALTHQEVAHIKSVILSDIYPVFSGDWDACWYNLNQSDYSSVSPAKVRNVCNQIKSTIINFFQNNYNKQSNGN